MNKAICCILLAIILIMSAGPGYGDDACGPVTPKEEQSLKMQLEHSLLTVRVKELETRRCISETRLVQKQILLLKDIAADTKLQRQPIEEFQGFVSWMNQNLAGYNKYIKAGSYAAVVGRMLPVPYAGQAAVFTKFAAQFTIALNNASVAMNAYLKSSQKFISLADSLDPALPDNHKVTVEAATFADTVLLKDMNSTHDTLNTVAELSAGALSFLETVNHYVSGTDEYWNKAKGLLHKDVDQKEKSYISESINSLKNKAVTFNNKLTAFEALTRKQAARVKSLAVYDELIAELSVK